MAEEETGVKPKRVARPLIAITQGNRLRQSGWWLMCLAVWLAGGRPRIVRPCRESGCPGFDGLIIAGGTDVHPDRYRGEVKADYRYDLARDAMEIALFERAQAERKPVLGICRGAQLINVARGGTLCLDVSKTYEKAEYPSGLLARFFYRKPVRTEADSTIARLLGCRHCAVNSMHTQSVLDVGQGLRVTAKEDNGIVQTVEDGSQPFVIGVQFHPEYLIYRRRFRRLFCALVAQAALAGR